MSKRGHPVAKVAPSGKRRVWKSSEGILAGKIAIVDDMQDLTHLYDCLREAAEPLVKPKPKAR